MNKKEPKLNQETVKAIDEARERFKKGILVTESQALKRLDLSS